jgi:hypothetical protein
VAAAIAAADDTRSTPDAARYLFVLFNLADGDRPEAPAPGVTRRVLDDVIVTWDRRLEYHPIAGPALKDVLLRLTEERNLARRRLKRLGLPAMSGLVYCRLVADIDELAELMDQPGSQKARVMGLTAGCRYVFLPVSHVTTSDVDGLVRRAKMPLQDIDVDRTLAAWRQESLRRVAGTLRHELVHVHVNSALGPALYSDGARVPLWFHEGVATWAAADAESVLSREYQDYLRAFVYLAERHGLPAFSKFVARVVADRQPASAVMRSQFGLSSWEELTAAANRWRGWRGNVAVAFTLAFLLCIVQELRRREFPFQASVTIILGVFCLYHLAAGTAVGVFGVDGLVAVRFSETALGALGVWVTYRGVRRLARDLRTPRLPVPPAGSRESRSRGLAAGA